MTIRKSTDLANESNSKYNNVKTATARAKITERFDDTTHNEQVSDEALQFLSKKLDDVIDQVNLDEAKSTNVTTNLSVANSTGARVIASSDGTNATIPVATTSVSGVMSTRIFDQHTANVAKNTNVTTNLGITGSAAARVITSSDGDNVTIPVATTSVSGLLTPALFDEIDANTAKVTNADQSKADINALDITEVGTISSGVWQGTTIKTAYIGNDQVTEDKLANTLLAEIDANTAKVTNVSTNLGITGSAAARVITSSDGDNVTIPVATTSVSGLLTPALFDEIDANTAKVGVTTATLKTALNSAIGSNALTIGDSNTTTTFPGNMTVTGTQTVNNVVTVSTSNGIQFEGAAADGHDAILKSAVAGSDKVYTLPNATGTVALTSDITGTNSNTNTGDETRARINALDITEVGTISSGVWQGTTIKTAYIGNDQVTEDKLANTLLAEIDANTAKVTNSDQSKADINALDITEVGTISSGVWQGTTIKTAYIGNDQVTEDKLANTLLAEIDANTAKVGVSTGTQTIAGAKTFSSNLTVGGNSLTAGSLDINGAADISGNLTGVDAFTASGKIQGAELEGTSLDINGAADISGALVVHNQITGTELEGTSLDINGSADISGDLVVHGKMTQKGVVEREEWGRTYTVNVNAPTALLTDAGAALPNGGGYRMTGHISGTGTEQVAVAVFWNENGTWYINKTFEGGTSSNHVEFKILNSVPTVTLESHASNYNVNVTHERLSLDEGTGTDNLRGYFGSDSYLSWLETTNTLTVPGAITSTGKIQGTELEGTSLDINGVADINAGSANIGVELTSSDAGCYIRYKDSADSNRWYHGVNNGSFHIYNNSNTGILSLSGTQCTIAGELEATSLDINGAANISGALTGVDAITMNGALSGTTTIVASGKIQGAELEGTSLDINGNGDVSGNLYVSRYFQSATGVPTNNLGAPTVTEMALFENQFKPQTTLANSYNDLADLTFFTRASGTGESDYAEVTSYSDDQKRRFLRTNNSSVIIPNSHNSFRIEFVGKSYTFANAMVAYWSSQSHRSKVQVYKRRCSDNAWIQHTTSDTTVSSWPGHLYLPFGTIPWHETNTSSTGHYNKIRIEFTPTWSDHETYGSYNINLSGMQIWGGYPSGRRTVHSYDQNGKLNLFGDLNVPGNITTSGLIDGVDIASRNSTLTTTTTTAGNALPKAGGTMSGAIAMGSQNITGGGTITGTTLTGTSLDINGNADISGTTSLGNALTITAGTNALFTHGSASNGKFHQFESAWSTNMAGSTSTYRFDTGNWRLWSAGTSASILSATAAGNFTFAHDVTISGGDIVLGGTGRIQGIDTVSANTDAANKAYVDAHVWNGNDITAGTVVSARLDADTAHLSTTQTFTGAKTFDENISIAGIVLDGNTISGIDDSGEFTDNDAHIMTSAAINDKFAVINADTTGNAATSTLAADATTLATPRAINGVDFDGSAAITVTAAAGTLSGNTLKSTVVTSSLTSVGTIATGVWQGTTIKTAYIGNDQVTEDKLANTLLAEIDANTAKVTNSDQSKADINALDITEVGTISSGVWQGTTIKTAYIGNDQVTEDKLANTLLAEIDANTAKVTNVSTNLGITGSAAARVITSSDGDNVTIPVATTSVSGLLTPALFDEIDANTAKVTNSDQSKADINALDITEVGTISSGVWQGTTIKTAYIGNDQVTEDKLANTLLAEIDANTAKATNVSTNLGITGSAAARVITSSDGDNVTIPVATTSVSGLLTPALFDEIDANTAKSTNVTTNLSVANSTGARVIASSDGTNATIPIATSSVSGVMSTAIFGALAANTNKVGFTTTMPTATDGVTCTLTATKNRGVINALVFTVIDSSGRSPVTKSATIELG